MTVDPGRSPLSQALNGPMKRPGVSFLSGREVASLIDTMHAYVLPPNILPLARDRQPFAGLPRQLIGAIIREAISSTTRKGRLTDAVKAVLGLPPVTVSDYAVIEAHIDLTQAPESLKYRLLRLGFEPDNFAEIQPPQYQYHFSIQHLLDKKISNKTAVFGQVQRAATAAARAIDATDGVMGYVETECYTSQRILKLLAKELNSDILTCFPFRPDTFIRLKVAGNNDEAGKPGFDSIEKRAADIHVKLSRTATTEFGEPRLEALLSDSGFYRIKSDAGNCMYSAHFSILQDSNQAYDELASFALESGGIVGMMREVCTSIWRKTDHTRSLPCKAEVPPHLRYRISKIGETY